MNILIENGVKIASKSCQNDGVKLCVSEGPTFVSMVLACMNIIKSKKMSMVAYRAQGMNPYLVAFQIATWCTFGC
jgi:hypothetical protein